MANTKFGDIIELENGDLVQCVAENGNGCNDCYFNDSGWCNRDSAKNSTKDDNIDLYCSPALRDDEGCQYILVCTSVLEN